MKESLEQVFEPVKMTAVECLHQSCQNQILAYNFTELVEGRTWLEIPCEEVRLVDFLSCLTDAGLMALMPYLILGTLYTEEADVHLIKFPGFIRELVHTGRIRIFAEEQLQCLCRLLGLIHELDVDDPDRFEYDRFIRLDDQTINLICSRK